MVYDIVLVADGRYVHPSKTNGYIDNVLLEDRLVKKALEKHGLKVTRVAWDDPVFDWHMCKYAVFRAVWDYFDKFEAFTQWFQKTGSKTRFINSKKLVRWNMDKHYLLDLNEKGIHIPTTLFLEPGTDISLSEAIAKADGMGIRSTNLVLKPCIAGGARHTYKFKRSEWERYDTVFRELVSKEAMMLQEFQERIVSEGELSMMVMNGAFTHAVLKRAKKGDFRVQDDWGGTVESYHPSAEEIAFAENTVRKSPELPLYGRVDIFRDNTGELALAELEIFEPELWFRLFPEAAIVLGNAIAEKFFA